MLRICLTVTVLLLAVAPGSRAQVAEDKLREREERIGQSSLSAIGAEVAKLGDWDSEYEWVTDAIDDMWESNGWDEEPDLFARDTVQEVAAIPPWEFTKRIETLSGALRDRYDLTDAQVANVNAGIARTAGALAFRHAGTILKQTRESVQARLRGEPFTPEQVARWSRDGEGMMNDMRDSIEDLAEEVAADFTPEQRSIYERDKASYFKRRRVVNDLKERWKRGEWQPEDWGLQHDPIHAEQPERDEVEKIEAVDAETRVAAKPVRVSITCDETAWARYVREFIARHNLDEAQSQAIWSILRELEQRAANYRHLYADDLRLVPPGERDTADAYAPIRTMFYELEQRLYRVPTNAQLRRAEVAPPPASEENAQASRD